MGSLPPSKPPTGPAPPRRTVCAPRGPSSSYRRPHSRRRRLCDVPHSTQVLEISGIDCTGPTVPATTTASRLQFEALEDRSLPSGTVSLAPNDPMSPLVGERVTWTATATDVGATPVYQFSAAPHGGAFHVVRDFSPANTFAWTPMQEGTYDIEVTVKDGYQATETTSAVVVDEVASRVTGSQAVVTPTLNPLVALYSVPPSSAGTVFVQFAVAGDHPAWRNTDARAVVPGKSTNFFVAGMLPNTTYQMRHVFSDGTGSAPVLFTTGSIPATVTIPAFTVRQPPGPGSDPDQDMVFHQLVRTTPNAPPLVATDLSGQVMWYYDLSGSGFTLTKAGQSLVPGGTLLLNGVDQLHARARPRRTSCARSTWPATPCGRPTSRR